MTQPLPRNFYERATLLVAPELLGKKLVRVYRGKMLSGVISEVEAYLGSADSASHAYRRMTRRNAVMFGAGGHAYVYFCYGMHSMLNVVAHEPHVVGAILIRGIFPMEGLETMKKLRGGRGPIADGPAKLCQALGVGCELSGWDLTKGKKLWIEDGESVNEDRIERTPRVGIDYAKPEDRDALWRFCLKQPI